MSLFSLLKSNSRRALRGNWGKAILVLLPTMLFSFVLQLANNYLIRPTGLTVDKVMSYPPDVFLTLNIISIPIYTFIAAFLLITIFISAPLMLGATYWHTNLVKGHLAPVSDIFRYFSSFKLYFRAIWFRLQIGARSLFWYMLTVIPLSLVSNLLLVFLDEKSDESKGMFALFMMTALLIIALILVVFLLISAYVNKYFLAEYRIVADDETPVRKIILQSIDETKGFRFSILWYQLSFIGWDILAMIPFVSLYVEPYRRTAMAMYAQYIIETNQRQAPVTNMPEQAPEVQAQNPLS